MEGLNVQQLIFDTIRSQHKGVKLKLITLEYLTEDKSQIIHITLNDNKKHKVVPDKGDIKQIKKLVLNRAIKVISKKIDLPIEKIFINLNFDNDEITMFYKSNGHVLKFEE